MSDLYSIMTSASEYVTGINCGTVSTVPNVNEAKRMPWREARDMLRIIQARYDNEATLFLNRPQAAACPAAQGRP